VKYLILLLHNSASREMFTSLPAEDRAAGLAVYEALTEELVESGELVVSSPLAGTRRARRRPTRTPRGGPSAPRNSTTSAAGPPPCSAGSDQESPGSDPDRPGCDQGCARL
jgi:hypothetical protein